MAQSQAPIDKPTTALLLIDLQLDFMPGGSLPVEEGHTVVAPIRRLIEDDVFGLYVATQDWHPPGHASFASSHPGHEPFDEIELHGKPQVLWPDHCVQGTPNAALHADLPWERVSAILRKGMDPDVDSYSGFRNNWDRRGERPPTGLAGYLRERGIASVHVCGLARDVCVKWTAEDAAAAGFDTTLLWDLSLPVDPRSDDKMRDDLERAGVRVLPSGELS